MSKQKANPMTSEAAARIQSTQAKTGKEMGSGGFAARAQAAAAHNVQGAAQHGSASKGGGQGSGRGHQSSKSGK